jgi:hypothetical protein
MMTSLPWYAWLMLPVAGLWAVLVVHLILAMGRPPAPRLPELPRARARRRR